jgi:hypothetical protein
MEKPSGPPKLLAMQIPLVGPALLFIQGDEINIRPSGL